MTTPSRIFSQKRRAYIYRVLLGAGAVGVFYGLVSEEEVVVLGGFLVTVLNIMPTANTSTKED